MKAAETPLIPLSVPEFRGNEWTYLRECLDTGWVAGGAFVERFERSVAEQCGAACAVAVSSGTAALHLALLCVGVEPGDEVLTSTLTFVATANAIRHAGAWPVLFDVEPDYWQLDVSLVADFLSRQCARRAGQLRNRRTGRRIRAILPVHLLGHPVDLDPLRELAEHYQLAVVEDAAESLGARYRGRPVGGAARAACFSFNGNKTVTTGGGGLIVTDDRRLAQRARYLSTQARDDVALAVHGEVGFNYRLSNLAAAIGCAQVENLAACVAAKRRLAASYRRELAGLPGSGFQGEAPYAFATSWLTTLRVDAVNAGIAAAELGRRLGQAGVETRRLWQPMHASPAHRESHAVLTGEADRLHASCLSLPSSVGLRDADQRRVCQAIRQACRADRRDAA